MFALQLTHGCYAFVAPDQFMYDNVLDWSCLAAGGLAPPLYVHRPDNQSISTRLGGATIENEWRQRIRHFMKYQVRSLHLAHRNICDIGKRCFTKLFSSVDFPSGCG
jgi:hypothetical protein